MNVFRIAMLESLPCALALLHFSGLTVTGLLASGGGILSWLFIFVFLPWGLGIWN